MKISILTPDSKIPNLAAMKISAWHKMNGDSVELNFPLSIPDMAYASILYQWTPDPIADVVGGPKYPESKLDIDMEYMFPDYSLYPNMDYSMGYTYKACPRTCEFCIVPKQNNTEQHYSIYDFHEHNFSKIALMNNNSFADPLWLETVDEIVDEDLTMIDNNGYDARLCTELYADSLKRMKWQGYIHTAWDFIDHSSDVLNGLANMKNAGLSKVMVYVLIGHTTHEENIHRIMTIHDMGFDPFVMPLNKSDDYQRRLARWCNHKAIFKTVKWRDYKETSYGYKKV